MSEKRSQRADVLPLGCYVPPPLRVGESTQRPDLSGDANVKNKGLAKGYLGKSEVWIAVVSCG
jgi:hypothetical protein